MKEEEVDLLSWVNCWKQGCYCILNVSELNSGKLIVEFHVQILIQ